VFAVLNLTPLAASSAASTASSAQTAPAEGILPVLDIIILVVLLVALVIGYQKGIIQPLMTYLFFFGALILIYRDRGQYLAGVEKYLHANTVLAIAFALIIAVVAGYAGSVVGQALHRMPIARGIDGFLGIFINVAIAIAVIYFVLGGLITFDKAFTPFVNNVKLTNKQVTTLSNQIESNPLSAALVDPKDLAKLKSETKSGQQTTLSTVTQLDNLNSFYQDFIRPQLRGSKLAPYVMRIGQKIPFLGHYGPKDLPK
jgi:uncharacterized membrane protein required for colicin V production